MEPPREQADQSSLGVAVALNVAMRRRQVAVTNEFLNVARLPPVWVMRRGDRVMKVLRPEWMSIRTLSWQRSMPRSKSRSSTFRSESGNRTYIMTTRRITSGDELNRRNGLGGNAPDLRLIRPWYHRSCTAATLL